MTLSVILGVMVNVCVLLVSLLDTTVTVLPPIGKGGTSKEVEMAPVSLVNPDATVVPAKVIEYGKFGVYVTVEVTVTVVPTGPDVGEMLI